MSMAAASFRGSGGHNRAGRWRSALEPLYDSNLRAD